MTGSDSIGDDAKTTERGREAREGGLVVEGDPLHSVTILFEGSDGVFEGGQEGFRCLGGKWARL